MPAETLCDGCGRLRPDVQPVAAWRDEDVTLDGHPDGWQYCAECAEHRDGRPVVAVGNRWLFEEEAVAQELLDAPEPAPAKSQRKR